MKNTEEFEFQSQAFIFITVFCCEGSPKTPLCRPLVERVNLNKRGIFAHFKESSAYWAGGPTVCPRDPLLRPPPPCAGIPALGASEPAPSLAYLAAAAGHLLSPAAPGQVGCEVCKTEHTLRGLCPKGSHTQLSMRGVSTDSSHSTQ